MSSLLLLLFCDDRVTCWVWGYGPQVQSLDFHRDRTCTPLALQTSTAHFPRVWKNNLWRNLCSERCLSQNEIYSNSQRKQEKLTTASKKTYGIYSIYSSKKWPPVAWEEDMERGRKLVPGAFFSHLSPTLWVAWINHHLIILRKMFKRLLNSKYHRYMNWIK